LHFFTNRAFIGSNTHTGVLNQGEEKMRMITLKDVNWGIEIECVGQTRETVARAIQSVVGGEVVHVGTPTVYDPWEVREAGTNRVWKVVADSSLSNVPADLRTEVVSPILGYADITVIQRTIGKLHPAPTNRGHVLPLPIRFIPCMGNR